MKGILVWAVYLAALMLAFTWVIKTLNAAEFEESGALLDMRLHELNQSIIELDERLKVLEGGEPPIDQCIVASVEPGQDPLISMCLPGRIQAEDYDLGGEGVAYHDFDPENHGGQYRTEEGVDIAATEDADGDYQIGWNRPGDWLEYTVRVEEAMYDVYFRVSCGISAPATCGQIKLILDGEDRDTIQVPGTDGWNTFETIVMECVSARAGNQIIRLEMLDTWLDLNWIDFMERADDAAPCETAGTKPPWDIVIDCVKEDEDGNCTVTENEAGALVGTVRVVPAQDL